VSAAVGAAERIRIRRWVVRGASCVAFLALLGGLTAAEVSAQVGTREDLIQRFAVRDTAGASFLQSYTSYILVRERMLAEQALDTPTVSQAQFTSFRNVFGFGPSVLLDAAGDLLDVAPYKASLIGTQLAPYYAHLSSAEAGIPAVSNVVASAADHLPVVAFATPFDTPFGRRVVSGAYDLQTKPMGIYLHHMLPYRDGAAYLVDAHGWVIASSSEHSAPLAALVPPLATALGRSVAVGDYVSSHGVTRAYAVVSVASTPWRLVVTVPQTELYQPISLLSTLLPWLFLGAFAFAGGAVLLLLVQAREARATADRAAHTDELTQLPNRRATQEAIRKMLADHRRYGTELGLLIFDVDRFKEVNDAFGHSGGDGALREVARRAKESLRINDHVGRWGGEEFVVLTPHTDRSGLITAAERVREAVARKAFDMGDHATVVTVSVGGAMATAEDDPDRLVARADAALYTAKETGRDRCIIATQLTAPAPSSLPVERESMPAG